MVIGSFDFCDRHLITSRISEHLKYHQPSANIKTLNSFILCNYHFGFYRAFGVLIWEVFALAMQPYPARSNIEVLQFVTGSGTLERPVRCPIQM